MQNTETHILVKGGERAARLDGPLRRCIVTRAVRPRAELLRFVLGPDGAIVPDVASSLPGRGIWVSSRRETLDRAIAKNAFSRAAKAQVRVSPELPEQIATLLLGRCLSLIGLARRSGQAVAGFAKVTDALHRGWAKGLLEASDGSHGGWNKLRAAAGELPVIGIFSGSELGAAFGREFIVHAAVGGRFAELLRTEALRLGGFRPPAQDSGVV